VLAYFDINKVDIICFGKVKFLSKINFSVD